jgi:DNA-directed RNA polymerase alpha subunit
MTFLLLIKKNGVKMKAIIECDLRYLELPIDDLKLSLRLTRTLIYANIEFIKDLVQCTETDLLLIPNVGVKSLNKIKKELAARWLCLRETKYKFEKT